MALVTKITVRLMRKPEAVKTILAVLRSTDDAGNTVAEITARAITPVAVEMLDGVLLRMVEEATHAGYPLDAAAVLLIELEGLNEAVEEQVEEIRAACAAAGRASFAWLAISRSATCCGRAARTRSARWGACSPDYYTQDGVVPRTQTSATLRFIEGISQRYGLVISNIFHAGDGNLHPLILFDHRIPGQLEKVKQASDEILRFCISVGGSITGRARRGHGEERDDGAPVFLRQSGHDRALQETVRPGMPS